MRRFLLGSLVLVGGAVACNSTDQGTIQLVTGEQTDVFTQPPAPTELLVYAVGSSSNDGGVVELASGPVSSTSIDLGDQNENGTAAIQVWGETDAGQVVVFGQSLSLEYGALADTTFDLFVQRTNELAGMPNSLTDSRHWPTLAILAGEFLFVGGGTTDATDAATSDVDGGLAETTQLYDFATYGSLTSPPTLEAVPNSMPVVGTVALIITTGQADANYYDFSQNYYINSVAPPESPANVMPAFTFADVAGGQTFYDVDPSTGDLDGVYVVGATRTQGPPTKAVLYINPNDMSDSSQPSGTLQFLTLVYPRLGAAAAAIHNRGLVVIGGSATGPGVEVVGNGSVGIDNGCDAGVPDAGAPDASKSDAGGIVCPTAAYPTDSTSGAGAVAIPGMNGAASSQVVVAGGLTPQGADPGVRVVSLDNCPATGCVSPWGSSTAVNLPSPGLANAYAFIDNAGTSAYVVGNAPGTGVTSSFLVSSTGTVTSVPTQVQHIGASAIESPVGSVLVYGGPSGEIESFTFPPH